MAGMAVALERKAAMVASSPVSVVKSSCCSGNARWEGGSASAVAFKKSSNGCAGSVAVAAWSVAGLGLKTPLLRAQRTGTTTGLKKKAHVIAAVKAEVRTEISVEEQTEVQIEGTKVQEVAEDLLKQVQETWQKIDDKLAVGGLGVVAIVVLYGLFGFLSAVDKLPIVPQLFEIVGLFVTGWFVYRYLLFQPDREDLIKIIDDTKVKITGQERL